MGLRMTVRNFRNPNKLPIKENNMYFAGLKKSFIRMSHFLMFKELGCLASRLGAYSYTSAMSVLEAFAAEHNYNADDVLCYAFNRMWNYPDYWDFEDRVRSIGKNKNCTGITRWAVPAYLLYTDNHEDTSLIVKEVVNRPWVDLDEIPTNYKNISSLLFIADLETAEEDNYDMAVEIASSYCEYVGYDNVGKFIEQCSKNHAEIDTGLKTQTQLDEFMERISLGTNTTLEVEYRKASPDARTRVETISEMFGMAFDMAIIFDMFCFHCTSLDAYNKFVASMVANDYTQTSAADIDKMRMRAKMEYDNPPAINNYQGYLMCNMIDAVHDYEHTNKVEYWQPPFTREVTDTNNDKEDTSSYDTPLTSYGGPTLYDVCTTNKEVIEAAKKYFNDNEPELLTYKLARDNNLNTVNEILAFLRKG